LNYFFLSKAHRRNQKNNYKKQQWQDGIHFKSSWIIKIVYKYFTKNTISKAADPDGRRRVARLCAVAVQDADRQASHDRQALSRELDLDDLLVPDILPTFSLPNFQAKGAVLEGAALAHTGKLALIEQEKAAKLPGFVGI
jgi:hypothetical protein